MLSDDIFIYDVVKNLEGQYSIWPEHLGPPPSGWNIAGCKGEKQVCLDYIKENWKEMKFSL